MNPIWLVGNGPSLLRTPPHRIRGATIASNRIYLPPVEFAPTYYTVTDDLMAKNHAEEINALRGSRKVFASSLRGALAGEGVQWVNYHRVTAAMDDTHPFSFDPFFGAYQGGSVTYFNLQLATWLGAKKIILVGCDHDPADPSHFTPEYFEKGLRYHLDAATSDNCDRVTFAMRCAFRRLTDRGIEVWDATPGGKLNAFPSIDFEAALQEERNV